jgi:hypothetical protein
MAKTSDSQDELEFLKNTTLYMNAKVLGVVLGFLFGIVIFIATNWLVIRGPQPDQYGQPVTGPHLALLGQYFIGYRVSFWGSLIGFAYAFVTGSVAGWLIAVVYNSIARLRR